MFLFRIINQLILFALLSNIALGSTATLVSMTVVSDEILWEIARDKVSHWSPLASHTRYSNIAGLVPKASVIQKQSLEALLKLRPAKVVLASYSRPTYKKHLAGAKIEYLELSGFGSFVDTKRHIRALGEFSVSSAAAQRLIERMDARLARLGAFSASQSSKPKVVLYSRHGSLAGKGTMFDAIASAAGATNIVEQQGWPTYGAEAIAKLRPDYIIVPGKDIASSGIKESSYWSNLPAVKRGRIVAMPSALISSVSQYALDAAETLSSRLRQQTNAR